MTDRDSLFNNRIDQQVHEYITQDLHQDGGMLSREGRATELPEYGVPAATFGEGSHQPADDRGEEAIRAGVCRLCNRPLPSRWMKRDRDGRFHASTFALNLFFSF